MDEAERRRQEAAKAGQQLPGNKHKPDRLTTWELLIDPRVPVDSRTLYAATTAGIRCGCECAKSGRVWRPQVTPDLLDRVGGDAENALDAGQDPGPSASLGQQSTPAGLGQGRHDVAGQVPAPEAFVPDEIV